MNHYRAKTIRCQLEFLCCYTVLAMKPKRSIIRLPRKLAQDKKIGSQKRGVNESRDGFDCWGTARWADQAGWDRGRTLRSADFRGSGRHSRPDPPEWRRVARDTFARSPQSSVGGSAHSATAAQYLLRGQELSRTRP